MTNEMPKQQAIIPRDYHDVIAKVASLKDLDVEKLSDLATSQLPSLNAAALVGEMTAGAAVN